MKAPLISSAIRRRRRQRLAFTLPEALIAMSLFMVIMGGVVFSHMYGLKMVQLARSKLGASDEARRAVSKLVEEIRSAKIIRIGSGGLTNFITKGMTETQSGNAIQVYPTTNTSSFVRYYWDPVDNRLKRTTNGVSSVYVVASAISNQVVFTAENHLGQVLTNNNNNRVIGLTLQFYQLQYPTIDIGPGGLYDFYQLRTRITRRALE